MGRCAGEGGSLAAFRAPAFRTSAMAAMLALSSAKAARRAALKSSSDMPERTTAWGGALAALRVEWDDLRRGWLEALQFLDGLPNRGGVKRLLIQLQRVLDVVEAVEERAGHQTTRGSSFWRTSMIRIGISSRVSTRFPSLLCKVMIGSSCFIACTSSQWRAVRLI